VREDERGMKGGRGSDGAPFISDAARGGGRATSGAMRRQGVGGQCGDRVARCGWQRPGRSSRPVPK
jgi:hypothetical protein